jgi:fumarylpyruvate hydrolase
MAYVISAPTLPVLPVAGTGATFPVRRIWCVGRNYAEHAREMGADPQREVPFFFAKPSDAVVPLGGTLPFPKATHDLHHEVELAVAIGVAGNDIEPGAALDHVFGYAVALDMTRRDLQSEAKRTGRPWDMGKGFDQSCPISAIKRARDIGHPSSGPITLAVNDVEKQKGDLDQMIWSVADCIAALSRLVTIAPGDLLLTGTPAGVGPVMPGDILKADCVGVGTLKVVYAQ